MTEARRVRAPGTDADLVSRCTAAAATAADFLAPGRDALAARVVSGGRVSNAALETDQAAAHALAWMATYAESLRQLAVWAQALETAGGLGEIERSILAVGFGEYLAQLAGGIPMSQNEIARPADLGLSAAALLTPTVLGLIEGNGDAARARLAALIAEQQGAASFGATGLDEDFEMIRAQFRRFADERVVPHAHGWHRRDALIPIEIVDEMGALGVFGLTIPEAYGGSGLPKTAMCVVSEELSDRKRRNANPLVSLYLSAQTSRPTTLKIIIFFIQLSSF
jgi:(2S)-methylsuccinyl-CoA dehydrogenase